MRIPSAATIVFVVRLLSRRPARAGYADGKTERPTVKRAVLFRHVPESRRFARF